MELVPANEKSQRKKKKTLTSGMILSMVKRDIDELIDEFLEGNLTMFADMKRVWLSRKFSYIYEAVPNRNLAFFVQSLYAHTIEELEKFRDLIVEGKDKGVEIAATVAKQMLAKNVFIFGAVDVNEASSAEELNFLTERENVVVRCAYDRLYSETDVEQFIHLNMGSEVDLNSQHKRSIEYAEAKKRAIKCAGEIVEIEDIKHISEEKELMGEKMEKLKEEWDSQKLSFYEQTKLDPLTTQKLLKDVEHDDDDGFEELYRLLSER